MSDPSSLARLCCHTNINLPPSPPFWTGSRPPGGTRTYTHTHRHWCMSKVAMMNGDVLKICLISVRQGLCERSGEDGGIYISANEAQLTGAWITAHLTTFKLQTKRREQKKKRKRGVQTWGVVECDKNDWGQYFLKFSKHTVFLCVNQYACTMWHVLLQSHLLNLCVCVCVCMIKLGVGWRCEKCEH